MKIIKVRAKKHLYVVEILKMRKCTLKINVSSSPSARHNKQCRFTHVSNRSEEKFSASRKTGDVRPKNIYTPR